MKLLLLIWPLCVSLSAYAQQDFDGPRPIGSSTDGVNLVNYYNTNIQLTAKTFSASHGILFNAYKPAAQVSGGLGTLGNTKYAVGPTQYGSGAGAIIFNGNGGSMNFLISPSSSAIHDDVDWGIPELQILRNGNIGMGVTSPSYRLEVNGTIRSKEIKVEAGPWPDYVFEPDYGLPSLQSLEKYIQEEKHLPEIPSALEMEQDGLELGEMNRLLLKKIEELTLYLIEQNKSMVDQKEQSRLQQTRIEKLEQQLTQLEKQNY